MRGKTETFDILSCATRAAKKCGLEAHVVWHAYREATMRSACGQVHQTPEADAGILNVLVRDGLRAACISVAECSPSRVRGAVKQASLLLPEVPENPFLPELLVQPEEFPEKTLGLDTYAGFPVDTQVKERAFRRIYQASQGSTLLGSARFFTAGCEIGVANTVGLARYHTASYSFLSLVVTGSNGLSSYADRASSLPSGVDVEGAIEEAFSRAALAQRLPFVDPFVDGKGARTYDGVFSHYAIGEWMYWVSMFTFNGLAVLEEQSYLSGRKPGEKVTGSDFSIQDDWQHQDVIALPFDLEGATRRQLPLIEKGIYRAVPYDGMTAKKAGTVSTGHSVLAPWGTIPMCLVVEGNSATFEDLVAQSAKPTIVGTYFNYPGMPDPREAVFTATTRHGTFLVEDGAYKAVCPPLRVRMRSFDALSRIEGMTPSRLIRGQENYGMFYPVSLVVPAMRIRDVDFVGSNPSI